MSSYSDPSEHSEDSSYFDKPRTIIEERDSSSNESEATSRQTPSRLVTQGPKPFAQAVYGIRGRVTARKSVPIPVRRTFRIPPRDEAGPSGIRGRSQTPSPSPPPPEDRAPVARPTGMTLTERYMFSGMSNDMQIHQMLIDHHDQSIDALMNLMAVSGQTMNRVIDVLGHTMASVHRLYLMVYLLMAMVVILLGWMIIWVRH